MYLLFGVCWLHAESHVSIQPANYEVPSRPGHCIITLYIFSEWLGRHDLTFKSYSIYAVQVAIYITYTEMYCSWSCTGCMHAHIRTYIVMHNYSTIFNVHIHMLAAFNYCRSACADMCVLGHRRMWTMRLCVCACVCICSLHTTQCQNMYVHDIIWPYYTKGDMTMWLVHKVHTDTAWC